MEPNLSGMKMTIRRKPDYFVEFIKDGQTMLIKIFVERVDKNTLLNKFSVEAVVKKDQTTVLE